MVKLRPLALQELVLVQSIAWRTWPSTFATILSSEQIEYMLNWMYDLAQLEGQLSKGHTFLVAAEENTELGFAGFELNYAEGPTAKLHKLYLLPEAQGKGLGKTLLLEVAQRARVAGQKKLQLNVNKYNRQAIDFYLRMGFVTLREEVNDIGKGYVMDDFLMELTL
jgi:ribosomal protein S18 acetylase RimI-like enzyme